MHVWVKCPKAHKPGQLPCCPSWSKIICFRRKKNHRIGSINWQPTLDFSYPSIDNKIEKRLEMKISKTSSLVMTLLSIMLCFLRAKSQGVYCSDPYQLCFQKYILCPAECPSTGAATNNKVCYVDCRNILCTSECRSKKRKNAWNIFFYINQGLYIEKSLE